MTAYLISAHFHPPLGLILCANFLAENIFMTFILSSEIAHDHLHGSLFNGYCILEIHSCTTSKFYIHTLDVNNL